MQRFHDMPFGAKLLDEGGAEFRLWAPEAKTVDLCIFKNGKEELTAMKDTGDKWFKVTVADAKAGTRYYYVIDGGQKVPDPASRFQPEDVHGPSEIIDPKKFRWSDEDWKGLPWSEAVLYELHTGTFSPTGTYDGLTEHIGHFEDLGVNAVELMPLSDFPGKFGWGYDGVLPYAPENAYGHPDDLKNFINEAHKRGIMVFLDVVYNHFGPDGNYLHCYAKSFFSPKHNTPWGNGINYDDKDCENVRQFMIHNVLYWLEEFRFDGLRFDAVDTICDTSKKHILNEIAQAVRDKFGDSRHIHLVLENGDNNSQLLAGVSKSGSDRFTAQWNDDIHHALHVLATGESTGYYADYTEDYSMASAIEHLGRCLIEGFAYQGDKSNYREGITRGTPSKQLPPGAFINFLQNHDQIGNRALGERLQHLVNDEEAMLALTSILLLAPSPPMLFMGEEWNASTPFVWFANFEGDLANAVREGRLKEFSRFADFQDPARRKLIPDPCSVETFRKCKLDWDEMASDEHRIWYEFYKRLIALRKSAIVPLIDQIDVELKSWTITEEGLLECRWPIFTGGELKLLANLSDTGATPPIFTESEFDEENILYQSTPEIATEIALGTVPPWAVIWLLSSQSDVRLDLAEEMSHRTR